MNISPAQLVYLLRQKGIEQIFHANTVTTSCSLIRLRALCSRHAIEFSNLPQTYQPTDGIDKQYGIFDSVFLDTCDIHQAVQRHNNYGPVLFSFLPEFLLQTSQNVVRVTRCNPTKWEGLAITDRWFQNFETLEAEFQPGNFDQMIVVPSPGNSLSLSHTIQNIILDDPCTECEEGDEFSIAKTSLLKSAYESNLAFPEIQKRVCAPGCSCVANYQANDRFRWKFFNPRVCG